MSLSLTVDLNIMNNYCLNTVPIICIGPTWFNKNYDERYLYNYMYSCT